MNWEDSIRNPCHLPVLHSNVQFHGQVRISPKRSLLRPLDQNWRKRNSEEQMRSMSRGLTWAAISFIWFRNSCSLEGSTSAGKATVCHHLENNLKTSFLHTMNTQNNWDSQQIMTKGSTDIQLTIAYSPWQRAPMLSTLLLQIYPLMNWWLLYQIFHFQASKLSESLQLQPDLNSDRAQLNNTSVLVDLHHF